MAAKKKVSKKKTVTKNKDVASSVLEVKKETNSDVLWNKIKGLKLDLFGLSNQTVENNAVKHDLDPEAVYLTLKATAVLPAIEEALAHISLKENEMFDISSVGPYTVIKVIYKMPTVPFVTRLG